MKRVSFLLVFIISFFILKIKLLAISDISISSYNISPIFDKNIHVYNVYVEENREIITLQVNKEENEIVTGSGSKSLKKGLNVFIINEYEGEKVDNSYTINIVRGDYISYDSSYLSNLTIQGYDIDFSKDKYVYIIDVHDESFLDVDYSLESSLSSARLSGDLFLNKSENTINIKVTNKDKSSSKVYTIIAYKEKNSEVISNISNKSNVKYIVFLIFSIAIFIFLFIYHIFN